MITAEELVIAVEDKDVKNNFKLAEVADLFENRTAKIKFDGEDTSSEKEYAYLDSYVPEIGDRILLGVLGGTYIILGKVNYNVSPSTEEEIDRYLFDLKQVIMQKGLNVTGTTTLNSGATIVGNVGINGNINAVEVSATGTVTGASLNVAGEVKGDTLSIAKSVSLAGLTVTGNEVTNGNHQVKGTLSADSTLRHSGTRLGFFNVGDINKQAVATYSGTPDLNGLQTKINQVINALKAYGLL